MKKILLVLIAASALAACKERKADPRPDYDGVNSASERSHKSLDGEAGGD